jgi:hypothetical protein
MEFCVSTSYRNIHEILTLQDHLILLPVLIEFALSKVVYVLWKQDKTRMWIVNNEYRAWPMVGILTNNKQIITW